MKKILAVMMVFILIFSFAGCGNNGDDQTENPGGNDTVIENNDNPESESGEDLESGEDSEIDEESTGTAGPGQQLNPEDLIMSDDDMEGKYDFGFKTEDSFGLMSVIEKTDYSDISALVPVLEERMKTASEAVLNTDFTVFCEYEEIEEDEIDKLTYAIGMENDDTESKFLEAGAYHNQTDGKHYQYVMAATENFYEVNEANINSALKTLEDGMGITISRKTLTKAAKEAFETAARTENYYSLVDSKTIKANGYQELVKVSVDAFSTEENEIGFYVSCERERCYE